MRICEIRVIYMFIIVVLKVSCYEKTLRKIVRSQSKMVQRPYSDYGKDMLWKNTTLHRSSNVNDALMFSGPLVLKLQRPKISTIISSVEPGRGKSAYSKLKLGKHEINIFPNELRLTRNTLNTAAMQSNTEGNVEKHNKEVITNDSCPIDIEVQPFYEIPNHSRFFPALDEGSENDQRLNSKENSIVIPENQEITKDNSSLLVKGIFIPNTGLSIKPIDAPSSQQMETSDIDKVDFFIHEKSNDVSSALHEFNISANSFICTIVKENKADINVQEKFAEFDIEPSWMSKKHFWNRVFESRYETLMRNPDWPALKVILIPRTHVDSIWKRTFAGYHNDTVKTILSNIVKKLQFYKNLTFSWNEVSHLSEWWKYATAKSKSAFRRLIKERRLELTTGGWVETDEATSHLFGLIHQLIEGHQWLKNHLNFSPDVAWLTNSVTHSPTMAYLLSTSGISKLVLTNLHYSWEEYLAEYQYSDFIWLQNWDNDKTAQSTLNKDLNRLGNDRLPKSSVLTHYLQFNSAGFKACGPNKAVCTTDFNFAKSNRNLDVYSYNIKEKSELLLEQYSKTGTITSHNVIIAPIGGAYSYEAQSEFDYQFNNYQKLTDYINMNRDVYKATVEFGTVKDYFSSILQRQQSYLTLKGDFLNFADLNSGSPAYWTGFFTSRPLLKILLRRLESTLRSTEILFSYAISLNAFRGSNMTDVFKLLLKTRETSARLMDRNVVSGTLTSNVLKYVHNQILTAVKDCWYIQEVTVSLMSIKPGHNTPYLQKYVYRDGEFISMFRTIVPGDQIYLFNSLSHERTEIIEIVVRNPNIRIIDHNKKDVTIQINPVWKYNSDNFIKISRRFFKIIFAVVIAPLTLELYRIKETYDATQHAATIYCTMCILDDLTSSGSLSLFNIQPIETGDIQLESYKNRLIFDEFTGFLKTVIEKVGNIEKTVLFDFGAFRSSDKNSGMFLFNTNLTKPLHDILMPYRIGTKSKLLMILSGKITTELTSVFGRFLQNTVRIYNLLNSPLANAIYVETKVDYEVSPKNRDLELFLSIQTDVGNGNPPEIYTDNNGFEYTSRIVNISRRIESNMYPITTMAYIQDRKSRLTLITDHAQGITALQEGQLVVMLDRRVLFNDGRGTNEGLADSSATCHRHIILLENFNEVLNYRLVSVPDLQLPSFSALYLANSLNYVLDFFIITENQSELCYYAFLPLIKASFPCDVSLVNYRTILNQGTLQHHHPSAALMILHRQSFSCQIDYNMDLPCSEESNFSLESILHNVNAVYQTNLVGTTKGSPTSTFNLDNFPAMELITLRIHF